MAVINEYTLHQRQILLLILVCVFVISVCAITLSILIINPGLEDDEEYSGRKHILFIVVDDLRPALGCYGDNKAITPNIDQIAAKSVVFKNAYTQQALDGPSRISFLTSRRPDSLHLYDTGSYWRNSVGNFVTLPEHFKNHGYETISVGKVFESGLISNGTDDYPYSWTEYPYHPPSEDNIVCVSSDNQSGLNLICPVHSNQSYETLPDILSTEFAIDYLRNKSSASNKTGPFFLAIGYNKPHIPFKIPKDYFDLYPMESMDLAPNNTVPPRLPKISWNPWTDIREKGDVKLLNVSFPYGPLPEEFQKQIRQGYYASLSYVDDQIGKLLTALEETGFAAHTTIVLLSDNGWSLGEHQEWSKYSNFDVALRVPLLVYIPEIMEKEEREQFHYQPLIKKHVSTHSGPLLAVKKSFPKYKPRYVTKELVELVDVFPTLAEIANIAIPPLCRLYTAPFCSEGISFYPVIEHVVVDPWIDFSWKTAVFSQYPRPSLSAEKNSDRPQLEDIKYMGYSIRTKHFHYIEWLKFDNKEFKPDWPVIISRELYDHKKDPYEVNNVCDEDAYSNIMIELSRRLKKGWRHAMPPGPFDILDENETIS